MSEFDTTLENLYLSLESSFDDDNGVLEALSELDELEDEDWFDESRINLEGDREDVVLILQNSDDPNSFFHFHIGPDEGDLHLHAEMGESIINEANAIMNRILDSVGVLELYNLRAHAMWNEDFDGIELPINREFTPKVVGVRFDKSDGDVVVQDSNGAIQIIFSRESDFEKSTWRGTAPEDFIETLSLEIQNFLLKITGGDTNA